ncbi:hypothetical protein FRB90_001938 [Tulasnella sp. 427]|nr:hypothetical protein FRB90_001938 [Tulasnella sp. 427]
MAIGPTPSAIYLQPPSASGVASHPLRVTIQPAALLSILDHYLRGTTEGGNQRVIGTLLGVRTDSNEVEVRNSFAALHSETEEQIVVDMDYHKTVYDLYQKVNPKEVIVGWYSTGSELDNYSALVHQNFFSPETAPHPAIHVVVNTGVQKVGELGVKAFISAPIGVTPRSENCAFIPIPCDLKFGQSERSGLDLLSAVQTNQNLAASTELDVLEKSLKDIIAMIDRVLAYIQSVTRGEIPGDERIARKLLDSLSSSVEGLEKDSVESLFTSHLQDSLVVSYLSNLVRSQAVISSRIVLLT